AVLAMEMDAIGADALVSLVEVRIDARAVAAVDRIKQLRQVQLDAADHASRQARRAAGRTFDAATANIVSNRSQVLRQGRFIGKGDNDTRAGEGSIHLDISLRGVAAPKLIGMAAAVRVAGQPQRDNSHGQGHDDEPAEGKQDGEFLNAEIEK